MILKYPLKIINISQQFGVNNANHPLRKDFYAVFEHKHPGVDFKTEIGTKIQAAYPGIVVRNEYHEGMGNVIGIRYGNIIILYAHLSKPLVKLGQIIKTGNLIGLSGDSGKHCTHPHLHFEIRDISKQTLREMVFDPPFNKNVKQLKESFTYIVFNQNTSKTLRFLALRYFGDEKYWKRISQNNLNLKFNPDEIIPEGVVVNIPNF